MPYSGLTAQVTTQEPASQAAQVVSSGRGETRVTPDRATVFIAVETRGQTAAAAAAENAERQRATLDTLRAMGLRAEQLSTLNYTISPDYSYDREGGAPPKVVGYVARNTIRAELRRLDQVGRVIDAALAVGANRIGGVQFSSSTYEEARRTALASAVANARANAEAMARAAGGSLGTLREVSSTWNTPERDFAGSVVMEAAGRAAAAETPIDPGEFTITATVQTRWLFVAGKP